MPIRTCPVIAIEGTQAAGKSTLVHALTAHYREVGIGAACTGEPARTSPFMETIVLHNQGGFDLVAELDLFAQQLTVPCRAARHQQLLITDKTPANVLTLARLVLDPTDPGTARVLTAMDALCRAWMPGAYDLIVYCHDQYDQKSGGDRFREKVLTLQGETDHALQQTLADTGVPVIDLPTGLTTAERVQWVTEQADRRGLAAA